MDRNRLWVIGSVVAMVVVIVAGWVLGIQPQLSATGTANQDRVKVESQNIVNETVLAKLKQDYQSIDGLKAQLRTLRGAVPSQADASAFVTELNGLAGSHQVTLKSISVADARPYTPPATPPVAATPAPTPTPTTGAAPGTAVPGTNAQITAANFVAIPVQLTITGTYTQVLDFVYGLQTGQRLFLVTTLSITVSTSATGAKGGVDATIGGFMYVLLNKGGAGTTGASG